MLQEKKEVFVETPPASAVVKGSADPLCASPLPNSSPAKLTGCRQSDSFDWLRGSSQARPLPWVHIGHVISERKTFWAFADSKGCILHHSKRMDRVLVGRASLIQERIYEATSGQDRCQCTRLGFHFIICVLMLRSL